MILSVLNSYLTQGMKNLLDSLKKIYSSNVLALFDALVTGFLGTLAYYVLKEIPFRETQLVYALLMSLAVWLVSMNGYDKIKQTIEQMIKQAESL